MHFFLTQFPATPQRTADWLEKVVLPSNDRILFLICKDKNEPIGNFGVCNIRQISGELDNIIRGRKGDHSRIIYYSAITILAWMFGPLSIKFANIHVFSNNIKAINLYSSVGFTLSKSQELRHLEIGDEIHFLVDSDEGDLVNFQYNEMTLSRDAFLHLHPWTVQVYPNI
jgi:RimJ/RimL family protein N-acetyltransferase